MSDFITVETSSIEERPNIPGYKVWSGAPLRHPVDLFVQSYSWTLVKEERYNLYRELDLNFDIKTIQGAKEYLLSIDSKIAGMETDRALITELLAKYGVS